MWAALTKAVAGVTESLGIEIPGLPIDLGAVGDTAATAANGSAPATSTNAAAAGDPWRTGRAPATARPPTRRARR